MGAEGLVTKDQYEEDQQGELAEMGNADGASKTSHEKKHRHSIGGNAHQREHRRPRAPVADACAVALVAPPPRVGWPRRHADPCPRALHRLVAPRQEGAAARPREAARDARGCGIWCGTELLRAVAARNAGEGRVDCSMLGMYLRSELGAHLSDTGV